MQKRSSHRASLIAGIVAAVIFVGGIASDLIASDLQRILQPYRLWVWLTIIVALVVAVATAIAEARRRSDSSGSNLPGTTDHSATTSRIANATAKRSAAVERDVIGGAIVTGDKNFVGNEVGGDEVGRDKIINIHPPSSSATGMLTQAHEIPPPPLGETSRAIQFCEQQLAIVREIGDRRGEGNALGNLGLAYADLGETHRAIQLYEQRLTIAREIGDRRGEGNALGNLGVAYKNLGETCAPSSSMNNSWQLFARSVTAEAKVLRCGT